MSTSGASDERASVGRRIGEARRQIGLTQAELAARIGVSPGILDQYESGEADASRRMVRIAEVTGKPVSWFTSTDKDEARTEEDKTGAPTEVGQRIAESRGLRGLTRRDLAEAAGVSVGKIERYESGAKPPGDVLERIAAALGEPNTWLQTGDPSAQPDEDEDVADPMREQEEAVDDTDASVRSEPEPEASLQSTLPVPPLQIPYEDLPRKTRGYDPKATARLFEQVADAYRRLWEARGRLVKELDELKAELADERRTHADGAREGASLSDELERVKDELERANANQQALTDLLEQARLEKARSRKQDDELPERVSELERELRLADERASATRARLEQAEKELERFREQERSLAEALVWARHTASDLSEKAEQEAERIVQEAERRAAEMVSESQREIERLSGERERLESLAHELQEDLTAFLRGTLERLNGEMESKTVPDESVA